MTPTRTSRGPVTRIDWADRSIAPRDRITAAERRDATTSPVFGTTFTEHMVSARWSSDRGWHDAELAPVRALQLHPATVALHYGQSVFEGLRAFSQPDGVPALFRVADHGRRLERSAARLAIPALPTAELVEGLRALVRADEAWVPEDEDRSLYLRPLLFAADPSLALRASSTYQFLAVATVTEEFFGVGAAPVTVWAGSEHVRATTGGTGDVKYGGNYAPTYLAQQEAADRGCQQVVWLDAAERRWVEELGGMNIFWVRSDRGRTELVTPPLSGTLLPGITRDSVLTLAADLGLTAVERPVSLEEWRDEAATGVITEAFACGTAAVLTPIGAVVTAQGRFAAGAHEAGHVCGRLRAAFVGVQRGTAPDRYGWLTPVR